MESYPALVRALQALDRLEIPWTITGSIALAAHGHLRYTHDADLKILVGPLEEYEEEVHREMTREGFSRIDEHTFEAADGFVIELYPAHGPLDREAFRRRIQMDVLPAYGAPVWLVAPEDLILLKLREYHQWGSPVQLDDVRALVVLKRRELDVEDLERRVQRHKLNDAWAQVNHVGN